MASDVVEIDPLFGVNLENATEQILKLRSAVLPSSLLAPAHGFPKAKLLGHLLEFVGLPFRRPPRV